MVSPLLLLSLSCRNVPCSQSLPFDERFEPGQSLIPLVGDDVEALLNLLNRGRIEFDEALTTGPDAVHESCALQDSKMLGDRLSGQRMTRCELSDRTRLSPRDAQRQGVKTKGSGVL
jgi:hypothetical protein